MGISVDADGTQVFTHSSIPSVGRAVGPAPTPSCRQGLESRRQVG